MGENIRKDAARESIMAALQTAHQNATAKGGVWKERADERIGPVIALHAGIKAQLVAASAEAAPLSAQVPVREREASATLGRISDEVWNAVGRPGPGSDAAYAILFPGGISYYVEGALATRPERMEVLVKLLVSGVHPKLPAARAQAAADEVKGAANALRSALDAVRGPEAQVSVLDRILTAVARSGALELANLKRLYKAQSFSEAEIHTVIPSHARARKAAKPAKAAPAPTTAAPAPAEAAPAPKAAEPAAPAVSTPA